MVIEFVAQRFWKLYGEEVRVMKVIVEQDFQQEVNEFANFLREITEKEREAVMNMIDGARFMNNIKKQSA